MLGKDPRLPLIGQTEGNGRQSRASSQGGCVRFSLTARGLKKKIRNVPPPAVRKVSLKRLQLLGLFYGLSRVTCDDSVWIQNILQSQILLLGANLVLTCSTAP